MASKKPEQESEAVEAAAAESASVVLKRGEEVVEVVSPTLVTKMKSQGWEVVE
jgi:hypothetical protein